LQSSAGGGSKSVSGSRPNVTGAGEPGGERSSHQRQEEHPDVTGLIMTVMLYYMLPVQVNLVEKGALTNAKKNIQTLQGLLMTVM